MVIFPSKENFTKRSTQINQNSSDAQWMNIFISINTLPFPTPKNTGKIYDKNHNRFWKTAITTKIGVFYPSSTVDVLLFWKRLQFFRLSKV